MFLAHSIRLRDPWKCEIVDSGRLRWSRAFHSPTGLEPDDDLWLVISGLPPSAQVIVNSHQFDEPNGAGPGREDLPGGDRLPASFNLTTILAERNNIELLIPAAAPSEPPQGAFPYDARLAIMART